ncbi:hypothetical protein CYCD_18750 [Tenuifilaceae bacterium CYCD]|nr:hypothetical protein CYCD_18750 [Tenuifilaceae bacterium CYCD]
MSEVRYQTEDIRFLTTFEMTRITNGFCHPERSKGSLAALETDPPNGGELAEGNNKEINFKLLKTKNNGNNINK